MFTGVCVCRYVLNTSERRVERRVCAWMVWVWVDVEPCVPDTALLLGVLASTGVLQYLYESYEFIHTMK